MTTDDATSTTNPLSIVVPSQTTPQTAHDAKAALVTSIDAVVEGAAAHLSFSDGPPSVLALQLCHVVRNAVLAKGATVTLDDTLLAHFPPSTADAPSGAIA